MCNEYLSHAILLMKHIIYYIFVNKNKLQMNHLQIYMQKNSFLVIYRICTLQIRYNIYYQLKFLHKIFQVRNKHKYGV